jgi:CoA:oxalate CoA-transferase
VSRWTAQCTRNEIYHRLQQAGLPSTPLNKPSDLLAQPQLRHRGFFMAIEHAESPSLAYPSAPYKFSRTPWAARRGAPRLGEHNEQVLCGLLGYPRRDLPALRAHSIV